MNGSPNDPYYKLICQPDPPADPDLHVVLVHGTYAAGATWVLPDSSFARSLQAELPGTLCFHRFRWVHKNSHACRTRAANGLRSELSELISRIHSRSQVLLVGHSHGGNVVSAAADHVPGERLAGVATLATPYFHRRRRSLVPVSILTDLLLMTFMISGLAWMIDWGAQLAMRVNIWLYGQDYMVRTSTGFWQALGTVSTVLGVIFMSSFLALGLFFMHDPERSVWGKLQDRARDGWDDLLPSRCKTLCLWSLPDEALHLLNGTRWLPERLHALSDWVHRHVLVALAILAIPVAIYVAVEFQWAEHALPNSPQWSIAQGLKTICQIALLSIAIPMLLWALTALVVASSMIWAFGNFGLMQYLLLDISIDRVPQIDAAQVTSRRLNVDFWKVLLKERSLVHSKLYNDRWTAEQIRDWLR